MALPSGFRPTISSRTFLRDINEVDTVVEGESGRPLVEVATEIIKYFRS